MNPATLFAWLEAEARGRAWAHHVSKYAVRVERDEDRRGYRVLHATKGWRFVSERRLGLA